ncbi:MAG: hypothetical protein H7061_07270 [Bdellovibrionaceae bacterium]|nr:hypothetical protein [Bdellovibrio sp.]
MSLAADNFDYRTQDFSKGPRRYFILGEDENPTPAKLQIEAIHKYEQQTEHKNSSIKLKHAGHIIPSDAPADYLEKILSVIKYEKLIK